MITELFLMIYFANEFDISPFSCLTNITGPVQIMTLLPNGFFLLCFAFVDLDMAFHWEKIYHFIMNKPK